MTNQDDDRVEAKSELRRALERALYARAQRGRPDEVTWGMSAWQTKSPPRHAGEAWFRDQGGACVKVIVQGMKSPTELGEALLDAIERMPVPSRTQPDQPGSTAVPGEGRQGVLGGLA